MSYPMIRAANAENPAVFFVKAFFILSADRPRQPVRGRGRLDKNPRCARHSIGIACVHAFPEGGRLIILTSFQTMRHCRFFRQLRSYINSLSGLTPPGFCVDLLFKKQKDAAGEACFLLVTRLPFFFIPRMIRTRIGLSNPILCG